MLAASLVLGGSGDAQSLSSAVLIGLDFGPKPVLTVGRISGVGPLGSAATTPTSTPPAAVIVDLAPGSRLLPPPPGPPPGGAVGVAVLSSLSGSTRQGGAVSLISGSLVIDDPAAYANDPSALACAGSAPMAVWRLTAQVLGLLYVLPIFVVRPPGDPQGLELRFCPPPLTGADGKPAGSVPVPVDQIAFLLSSVSLPSSRGDHVSRAFVTSQSATGAADPASQAELRALDPIPHTLTLHGRYDARSHAAILSGRVLLEGRPQARATVELVTENGERSVRTSADGTFRASIRIRATIRFAAAVSGSVLPCSGASAAPRGCLSETVNGTPAKVVRVVVPKRP